MSRDDDTDSNPLCALTDDLIHECQSESRIAMQSHSASRKAARQEAAAAAADSSATATASLIRAPRFDKSSDAYWLDRAQRRAHSQHASVGEAADGSSSAETAAVAAPRRVRKPRPKKGTRASAFMHWLFDTFDLKDRNRQAKQTTAAVGSEATDAAASTDVSASPPFHVVDVAGGRGQLAFFLSAFHSIPVSVIDPATMEGVRRYSDRYHLQRVQHRRERENNDSSRSSSSAGQTIDQQASPAADSLVGASAGPSLAAASAFTLAATAPIVLSNGVVLPVPWLPELSHFRCLFPDSIALSQHKQFARPVSRPCCESSEDDESVHDDAAASPAIISAVPALSSMLSSALASTLSSAALLYGMHSDGATEALVDYALQHQIDFAVVPCCVFPDAAPQRRVRATAKVDAAAAATATDTSASSSSSSAAQWVPVRSYAQFLDYLQAKHPEIRRVDLPFEGRNTCLYRRVSISAKTH